MKHLIVAALLTVFGATDAALAQQNQVTAGSNIPLDKQFAEEAARGLGQLGRQPAVMMI